jgi:CubicO group peptidase (beta-lactamase class C family)
LPIAIKTKPFKAFVSALLVAALGLGLVPTSRAGSPLPSKTWEPFFLFATGEGRAAVQETMNATGATAVSLALVDGDRFVWTEAFGLKDVLSDRPIFASEETMFGLGPVSKLLTAIAVMKLVERGALRLEDPVAMHLPEFSMRSPEFRQITVRMLLSHASGLPGTDRGNLHTSLPFPDYRKQVLATLADQRLKHPPGSMHSYCNDGYTLLEELVGVVAMTGYVPFVQKEMLDPLGMSHTRFPVAPLPDYACARAFRGRQPLPREYTNAAASAGLYSTPADMARLITMLVNGGTVKDVRILDEASIAEMGRDQTRRSLNPVPSALAAFGLGWDTVNQPSLQAAGLQAWSIQGETPQYGTALVVVPSERMGVIVTGTSGLDGAAAAAVAERILLRKLVEKKSLTEMPKAAEPLALPPSTEPEQLLPRVSGIYASSEAAFKASPGTFYNGLKLERFDPGCRGWKPVAENLRLRTDGWWVRDEEPGIGYLFKTVGRRQYLARRWTTRFSGIREVFAERVAPGAGLDPEWRCLIGRTWVLASDRAISLVPDSDRCLELVTLPGVDDLLFVKGRGFYPVDGSRGGGCARMMLQIPGFAGRDLDDLRLVPVNGELWLQSGSRLFRPLTPGR